MFRRLCIIFAIGLLALVTACHSSSSAASASGTTSSGATVAATATPGACPTAETKKFAKTLFVADVALAGGAFERYIYKPARAGQFQHGAKGKVVALIKAAAAGAFVIDRLNAARVNVENDPALCNVLIAPLKSFASAVSSLIGKAKNGLGSISPSDVEGGSSTLTDLHNAASQVGTAFTNNTSASP